MKNILLFISIFFFQISFSQVITFECNNTIITVSWEEIANNPNAYMDWDEDGDIDEDDATMYLYDAYDCENSLGGCEDYTIVVVDCAPCADNEEMIFWEEVDELNCLITEMCSCFPLNNVVDWDDIDWVDSDWSDFDWETVWSDYDLGNVVDWDNIPWGDITDLNIFPDDLITYIQNIIALGQGFNWDDFVVSMQGGEDCCINPEWIDPMAMCSFLYDPVIACDGLEYANSCVAEASGVTSYVDSMGNETVLEWDCNQGVLDCVDDPEGILAQYSYQCNDIVGEWFSWDCADDLSVAVPGVPSGMWTIGDLCPQSCDECDNEVGCVAELIPDCVFMTVVDPVCGCNGVTYSNSGEAACNNIFDFTMGECEGEEEGCWEEGEFYCIGCELFIDDCTYVECEGPNNWSDWIEIPDCGGVDCVDDPDGMLAQYGFSCSELLTFGCDTDLSSINPLIPFGISVYEICPESCTDCGEGTVGCTDMEACNYNPDATTDDGSCDYGVECFVSPCSVSEAPGIDGAYCVDDYCEGCCALWYYGDGTLIYNDCEEGPITGCTELNAVNYNPDATDDDGSCEYAWEDCDNSASPLDVETFDNYNLGNIDPQSSDWIGWDNGNSGVDVVDFSMNTYLGDGQSILVEQGDDLVWDLDGINTGSGEVTFHMYIPSTDDAGAYYNMLHDYNAANSNWAFQVLFASASSGDQSYIDLGQPVYFDAIYDTWVEVRHEIDIDNDLITLYYNNEMISSWEWSGGSAGASSVLDALNLFGFCTGTPCSGLTYYDNIEICGDFYNNVNIEEEFTLDVNLYPNPNKGSFNIVLNEEKIEFNIRVFNILGKEVYFESVDSYVKNSIKTIDLDLTKGTYIVNLETNNSFIKIPMIIE